MANLATQLEDMQEQIEDAKEELAKKQGERDALMKQLLGQFGVKTLAAAKKKITALNKQIKKEEKEIEESLESLRENYDWD